MPIRKRGDAYQVDVTFEGLRRQRQAPDEVAALRMEADLLEELKKEVEGRESKKWTLETAINKCHALIWKGTKAEHTTMKNAKLVKEFFGGDTLITEIDTDWIDDWIKQMEESGNSGGTINRKLACLSRVLTFAYERGALEKVPHFERRTENPGRIRFVTREEEATILQLLRSWEKHDQADFTVFLVDTGCRPSEGLKLGTIDCNFETGMVTFWDTKNGTSRSVPMTLRVREILERRTKDSVKPFPFKLSWYTNQWERVRARMGLMDDPDFVPYCLRHTCASRLAQKDVSLKVIQDWMGHEDIKTTLRYAHLMPSNLTAAAKLLDEGAKADNIRLTS